MLCPSCHNFRPANNAPCATCQAPSPLASNNTFFSSESWQEQQQFGTSGVWGGPDVSNSDWSTPSGQLAFSQSSSGQLAFPQSPWQDASDIAAQQLAFPTAAQQSPGQSLLPVPYQGQPGPAPQSLMVLPNAFTSGQANPLLPALPDADQEEPVYVAPMYTKPRPLIPRYRAISGLLSVIIVFALLCAGVGYYAQVTGKLVFFQKLMGTYSPPVMASSQQALPVPSMQATVAPGANIITSAGISNNIDQKTGNYAKYVNQFTIGELIYLTCNINSNQPGTITVRWYSNNNFYRQEARDVKDPKVQNGAFFQTVYAQATEGKVEIYWNNQLQRTLLFVVEPIA